MVATESLASLLLLFVDVEVAARSLIHGIFDNMGLLKTRLVAWVDSSAGQEIGIHGSFNYMIVRH